MSFVYKGELNIRSLLTIIMQAIKGKEHDYTKGSIRKAIILLAIPMILELCLESVFAVVDMFFVGRLGENAIATVGLTESVVSIIYAIAIGLSMAATALVARRTGEKNREAAAYAGAQTLVLALIISLLLSIAGIVLAPSILRLMGAAPEVVSGGSSFARIMLGGSSVIIFLFLINGIFRGAGNAAMAMRSLWLASISNMLLCPLFIYGMGSWNGWGLEGAAIATCAGRGLGVAYQCYHLFIKKSAVSMRLYQLKPNIKMLVSVFRLGWPASFQFLISSGSWVVLTKLIAETGGTTATAGYQIALRNVVFFILPAWGFSNAAATLVGQNLGAKEPERAERSVVLTAQYNAIFMLFVMLLFVFFAEPIISIYTNAAAVKAVGTEALQIIGSGYIFYGIGMVMMQALNGAGDTKTPTYINIFGFWILQIPLAMILAKTGGLGPSGAFIAIPVAETAMALLAYWFFRKGKWKKVLI